MDAEAAVENELQRLGVEPERVTRLAALAAAPDPEMAVAGWERLLDVTAERSALATVTAPELAALCTVLGASQPLSNTLHAAGDGWLRLFRACLAALPRAAADHAHELAAAVQEPWTQFSERLRQLRHREYLRVGLADLTGRSDVDTTMRELSELAAGCFAAAYGWAQHSLQAQYGTLETQDSALRTQHSFVVLAMGKLGGGELNFSSDVDVMYLYASDAGTTRGGPRGTVEARAYFTRLAELITRALQEMTPAGFAFRVDLRLRPEGINGPIVNPLDNALLYYGSYGQTWERTALIQARPIAGTLALGAQFLREVQPFVYRRYLDYATVADMKDMKARVEAQLGEKVGRGNVKLGRGGIREIEFFVQVLQLIHGGRDERLRGGGSLPTLARLVAGGYLPADEGATLAAAYRFLRNVEHKIQIVHQRQTHTVPKEPREQETLARRLGYRGAAAVARLWADIDRHTDRVRRAFEKLFYEAAAETQRAGVPETVHLLRTLDQRAASVARLQALGFKDAEASYENLRLLRDGPPSARARARRQKALYELAPALLGTILKSADPDLALQNLATFITSVGARTSFLALLRENPGTLRMLVELFGGSQFLANTFIRHPELLDTLVRADLVRAHRSADDLAADLQRSLAEATDIEDALDVLRHFRNQEFLRIGINDLQSLLEPSAVSAELTTLAEVCLRSACEVATNDVCRRYGWQRLPGRLMILGMGKLGGAELNYNSDLDLLFIYDYDEGDAGATVSAHERFSKLAQRLITVLQVTTKEGLVYRIDTRLRPSGRSGPLVSSLGGFRRYHETSAQTWERQALIKARAVAGDPALAESVETIVSDCVYRAPLTAAQAHEIRRLRQRMERELAHEGPGHVNIKTGRGGLVDVEFLTQVLQLRYGAHQPRVRVRNTLGALEALAAVGVLPAEDHALLAAGYRFLRRVENALRLAHDRPVEDLDRRRMDLTVVAKRMGIDGAASGDALWHAYEIHREAIRGCYERWFDRAEAGFD
ncbi:MAG TPA: bifunctional [glutamate--ammonia ligase]-adenylyl-L-tyrosine phosphorylase/[glutamate--ammonia-ligase] adenylyltransferase [Candidatus Acidoferrales bacterium]|nr:bifunctional [glutamate--ammonia ligase]-adenylyl-L-tyrosine phosphorylase/[glutamate--ammonia-ligase] adenylyltransferase [Candidatus Acidoferrales bacterium]